MYLNDDCITAVWYTYSSSSSSRCRHTASSSPRQPRRSPAHTETSGTRSTIHYMLTQYPESENRDARFAIFLVSVSSALAYLAVDLAR